MRERALTILRTSVLAVALVASACSTAGPDASPAERVATAEAPAPAASEPELVPAAGFCDLAVGAVPPLRERTTNDGLGVGTDYWKSERELRELFAYIAREDEDEAYEDASIPIFVEARMKEDPRHLVLGIVCAGRDVSVNLGPGGGTRYADVPFGPGRYPVAVGNSPEQTPKGSFAAMARVKSGSASWSYSVVEPGTLEITRFDTARIVGSFSFRAAPVQVPASVVLFQGRFDFKCIDSEVCSGT